MSKFRTATFWKFWGSAPFSKSWDSLPRELHSSMVAHAGFITFMAYYYYYYYYYYYLRQKVLRSVVFVCWFVHSCVREHMLGPNIS